ncbi:regulator of G protein signaling superfamily [Suhomyces tanzawaensis NRRL Y-17324]|uniref:Regulator of G protein signaling superfamily n=1 Tax=Suhomyces tanzawaensis NRRL Y-17324 TaxID=984487 RepID=A0A1E4SI02_9ASCO|nr:regulator of G protein signaling superfamily [Suhomyces tanzawaensis NRRL Y-17324]ODV79139.1 regulator of G protein signaling superfamily [Suhomyces tanzawaensis NRRL Y-17324]
MSEVGPRTLHRNILTDFNKTSTGKVFEKDLRDIYAMTVICLDLKPKESFKLKFSLVKQYPYGFYLEQALAAMKDLTLKVELNHTTTSISYNIQNDLAFALLKRFFEAKLLHSPAERTRSTLKPSLVLQPTPKGVAIVQDFCTNIGIKKDKLPDILNSPFNSMDLFKFDRAHLTDKIIYSEYLLYLLFIKLFSRKPNVWTPKSGPDSITMRERLDSDQGTDEFNFEGLTAPLRGGFEGLSTTTGTEIKHELIESGSNQPQLISPFHHRYFTNPESDSHIQYYVSTAGVRLFKDKVFKMENQGILVNYCVSGKSICQWLYDCTDILSAYDCIEIGNLFVKYNLLTPIRLQPSKASSKFAPYRDHFYLMSNLGQKVCYWNQRNGERESSSDDQDKLSEEIGEFFQQEEDDCSDTSSVFNLRDVLHDHGLRYLFKKHLENEFCSENLDAYFLLNQFEKRIKRLGKVVKYKKTDDMRVYDKISKFSNLCLSLAYHIFFTYLSYESPFVLNIDYQLRDEINCIMIESKGAKTPTDHDSRTSKEESPKDQVKIKAVSLDLPSRKTVEHPSFGVSSTVSIVPQTITDSRTAQSQKIVYTPIDSINTPLENGTKKSLRNLARISKCFSAISTEIYKLMEADSFPKIVHSELLKEATSTIEIRKSHTTISQ